MAENKLVMDRIRMKPTRTLSGLATVTVLTKPFPCPGKCIFCPNDVRMPKSYLASEPGAQRAERNSFDPYLQTYNRLLALHNTGHNVEKVELIILGGTWSFYPRSYQIWFVKRCFDALNDFLKVDNRELVKAQNSFVEADRIPRIDEKGRARSYNEIVHAVSRGDSAKLLSEGESADIRELSKAHKINETAICRCVGLVIETRPDFLDEEEVTFTRSLGATKIQIGIQSLNDKVLGLNKRGHNAESTKKAISLLRRAGFKIHAHWMPNLYGATPKIDIEDFKKLWESDVAPDELKLYPTSIIANTELFNLYKQGSYKPYTQDELLHILKETMAMTPRYCRLTRVIRDIPSTDIVAGNKKTNFRQIAERVLEEEGRACKCIRCREVKSGMIYPENELSFKELKYMTTDTEEVFLSVNTLDDKLVGFLRLSLPKQNKSHFIPELIDSAIIREVHVYGKVTGIGDSSAGSPQHLGLGRRLLEKAEIIAKENGYEKISVISAIGTREYYKKNGYTLVDLYMSKLCKS
ncbi:MAG: coproporphyrinogen III oxidase [candidate division WS6 bacterium OLB21]|nr:MAG: coproporphyrinogen III oxidase [candidate division WS6 bacterium OLB21]